MNTFIRLSFISGLQEVVISEISKISAIEIIDKNDETISIQCVENIDLIRNLKSITNAHIVVQDKKINPLYLNNHKSILGTTIELVLANNEQQFKTFIISCAGKDSPELDSIKTYITTTYKLSENIDANLKINLGKKDTFWELTVCITPLPLSVRNYKVSNIPGSLNPTIAYAINSFLNLGEITSYLNIFSGSATLLIEAGLINKNLKLVGIDYDGKRNSEAIKNIKKAGLIKSIDIQKQDIYTAVSSEKYDAIVSDLPFGMKISKDENLSELYTAFIRYCEKTLIHSGTLVIYTTEFEILEKIIRNSNFIIEKQVPLKLVTSVDSYLYPKIIMCKFK